MARDWEQQLKDTFQPHVSEPVEAIGLLQPSGTMGSFGLGRISPLAAIVLTANKVHAFRTKQKGYNGLARGDREVAPSAARDGGRVLRGHLLRHSVDH